MTSSSERLLKNAVTIQKLALTAATLAARIHKVVMKDLQGGMKMTASLIGLTS